MGFSPLRGFRDYLPPDAGARSEILRRFRASARRCGFQELETPSVENLELYRAKGGDAITAEIWEFRDKGGREVALAPESTPSLARVLAERAKSEPMPVKWFTVAKHWRYEEPQSGRTREFTQFNLDILGVPEVEAEVELLAAAALLLDEAGAEGLYAFRLNDRDLAEAVGRHFGATQPAEYLRAVDRYAKDPPGVFAERLAAAGLVPEGQSQLGAWLAGSAGGVPVADASAWLDRVEAMGLPAPGPEGLRRLRRLVALLPSVGLDDRVRLDPTVVRGLAYYTGCVFEAYDRSGEHRSLFGGGRYDGLIARYGGPATPAVGLAIGDQTLELLLRAHDRWPEGEPALDTYVVAVTPEQLPVALALVRELRRGGRSADCDLMGRTMSRQLREAARRRAKRAILLGPRELARGVVVERDLATGEQRELPAPGSRAGA